MKPITKCHRCKKRPKKGARPYCDRCCNAIAIISQKKAKVRRKKTCIQSLEESLDSAMVDLREIQSWNKSRTVRSIRKSLDGDFPGSKIRTEKYRPTLLRK